MTDVYLEIGKRRSFASAVEWPGWTRAGRDPEAALANLAAYESRYVGVLRRAGISCELAGAFRVVQRIAGDATTDFGAPSQHPQCDLRPLDESEAKRLTAVLKACWQAVERAAAAAPGALRKGPRGGGRELPAVLAHVVEADQAYAGKVGVRLRPVSPDDPPAVGQLRSLMIEAVHKAAAADRTTPLSPKGWPARYLVRRSAWHALDHAWEIEDRSV